MNIPNSDGFFYLYRTGWPARSRVEVIMGSKGIVVRLRESGPLISIEDFPFDCEWILTNPGPLGIVENDEFDEFDEFVLSNTPHTGVASPEKTIRQERWEQELDGLNKEFNALIKKAERETTAMRRLFGLLKVLYFFIKVDSKQYTG